MFSKLKAEKYRTHSMVLNEVLIVENNVACALKVFESFGGRLPCVS